MMDPDYDLFAAVSGAASLSAVARDLRMSPAMVSKRLARLEARLGVRLVHRTTRRLSMTEAGALFAADVAAVREALRIAEARVTGEDGVGAVGTLRLSAPTSFGRLHVAPHLKAFLDANPRVQIELDLSDEFTDLFAQRIDLAIRIASEIGPGLTAHRLGTNHRILCATASYVEAHGAPDNLDDLQNHHLLAVGDQLPWRLSGPEGPVLAAGESRVRTNSSEVVRELALAGAGIALRSFWDVGTALEAGRLVRLLPRYQGSEDVGVFAVHPRSDFVPRTAQRFLAYLREVYDAAPPWRSTAAGERPA